MGASLTHIWRTPIKSLGRQNLTSVDIVAGETLPLDRHWALLHENAKTDGSEWAACNNFIRGAKHPKLMAIDLNAKSDGQFSLTHPDLAPLDVEIAREGAAVVNWVAPLITPDTPRPTRLISLGARGMTDTDYPSISLGNLATHRALEEKTGQMIDLRRWRINLWVDGFEPWAEFSWIGKSIAIGAAKFDAIECITRCKATTANPETGARDLDTLALLREYGHQDLGIYMRAKTSATININDEVQVFDAD